MLREPDYEATHVLVVDDEPDILELLVDALVSQGYRVSTATNGEQALEIPGSRASILCCATFIWRTWMGFSLPMQ